MYARLWWKDARQFWPLLLAIPLLTVLVQGVLFDVAADELRDVPPAAIAVGWAMIYAIAVGAAAFAGERESDTLLFLDAHGADRRTLWLAKSSFLLVSTAVLAVVLVAVAKLSSGQRTGLEPLTVCLVPLLLAAMAWSLFWSSHLANPLLAAVLAIFSLVPTGGVMLYDLARLAARSLEPGPSPVRLTIDAMFPLLALAGSWRAITRVVPRRRPNATSRVPGGTTRSLLWLAWREGRTVWAVVLALFAASLLWFSAVDRGNPSAAGIVIALLGPAMGVFVFNPESRARTYRFAAAHGVSPGAFWRVRQGVWCAFLAMFALAVAVSAQSWRGSSSPAALVVILAYGYAAGQLSGMIFPRSITAWGIALTVTLLLLAIHGTIALGGLAPLWTLAIPVLLLLVVSREWVADWMYETPGPRRWVRLGLLLLLPYVVLGACYVSYRAWSVPRLRPPLAAAQRAETPPQDKAREGYRLILDELRRKAAEGPQQLSLSTVLQQTGPAGQGEGPAAKRWSKLLSDDAGRLRELTRLPVAYARTGTEAFTPGSDPRLSDAEEVANVLEADHRARLAGGDLAGAWQDVISVFRLARQIDARPVSVYQSLVAITIDERAARLAFRWASDCQQTLALLRAARLDLTRLGPLPTLQDAILAETEAAGRTLAMPSGEMMVHLASFDRSFTTRKGQLLAAALLVAPWERERARRVYRLISAARWERAAFEPCKRPSSSSRDPEIGDLIWPSVDPVTVVSSSGLREFLMSTPLVRIAYYPGLAAQGEWDRHLVRWRALELVLALRSWQIRHDGAYPESLGELVPGELPGLPLDPYCCQDFRYGVWRRRRESLDGVADNAGMTPPPHAKRDQRRLYSVGPDATDQFGQQNGPYGPDLVFPLPEGTGATRNP